MATPDAQDQHQASRGLAQSRSAVESLPPQRRAQLLLLNMAALSTRLIELSGNKEWQGGQSKPLSPQLLRGAVLPPEAASATSAKDVFNILDSYQTMLFEAIGEIIDLQEMEAEKQRIAETIATEDASMREFAKRLRDAQQVLEATVEEFEDYKRPKKDHQNQSQSENQSIDQKLEIGLGTINVQELVAYAHRISYTTFAPPEFAEGAPLRGALPPAPQDEQLRASKLYQINDLDLGIPKLPPRPASPLLTGGEPLLEVKMEGGATPKQAAAQAAAGPLLPPLPAGWKPGMPVELPPELPPMPAGWKPGDPLPFPPDVPPMPPAGWKPGDAVVLPPNFAPFPGVEGGAPAGPIKAAPLPGAAGPNAPIFVPYVSLDLNPELEDPYASEYSDEDGSSDDDDD